jgi:hypothetical protein
MPYNRSKATVVRMQSYLRDMAEAQTDLFFPSAHPPRLAYRIREALNATRFHPEFHHLSYLKDFYELSPVEGGVRVRYLGEPRYGGDQRAKKAEEGRSEYVRITREKGDGTIISADPITGEREISGGPAAYTIPEETPLAKMKIAEVEKLEGIVGAAIKYRNEAEEIYLPRVRLNAPEKRKLWLWGKTSGWRFIDHEEDGITITRRPIDEGLLWAPEEETA